MNSNNLKTATEQPKQSEQDTELVDSNISNNIVGDLSDKMFENLSQNLTPEQLDDMDNLSDEEFDEMLEGQDNALITEFYEEMPEEFKNSISKYDLKTSIGDREFNVPVYMKGIELAHVGPITEGGAKVNPITQSIVARKVSNILGNKKKQAAGKPHKMACKCGCGGFVADHIKRAVLAYEDMDEEEKKWLEAKGKEYADQNLDPMFLFDAEDMMNDFKKEFLTDFDINSFRKIFGRKYSDYEMELNRAETAAGKAPGGLIDYVLNGIYRHDGVEKQFYKNLDETRLSYAEWKELYKAMSDILKGKTDFNGEPLPAPIKQNLNDIAAALHEEKSPLLLEYKPQGTEEPKQAAGEQDGSEVDINSYFDSVEDDLRTAVTTLKSIGEEGKNRGIADEEINSATIKPIETILTNILPSLREKYSDTKTAALVNSDQTKDNPSKAGLIRMLRGAEIDECGAQNLYGEMIEILAKMSPLSPEIEPTYFIERIQEILKDEANHQGVLLDLIKKLDPDIMKNVAQGISNTENVKTAKANLAVKINAVIDGWVLPEGAISELKDIIK